MKQLTLDQIDQSSNEGKLLMGVLNYLGTHGFPFEPNKVLECIHKMWHEWETLKQSSPAALKQMDCCKIAKSFKDGLTDLINRHSKENGSNTPDFILAAFLLHCLDAFNGTVICRDDWFKFDPFEKKKKEREGITYGNGALFVNSTDTDNFKSEDIFIMAFDEYGARLYSPTGNVSLPINTKNKGIATADEMEALYLQYPNLRPIDHRKTRLIIFS